MIRKSKTGSIRIILLWATYFSLKFTHPKYAAFYVIMHIDNKIWIWTEKGNRKELGADSRIPTFLEIAGQLHC
jgi:hypothetical protein